MMKRLLLSMMMALSMTTMMGQGMQFEPAGTTLEQASVKAKAENKLIFLDCYTTWCGPCKVMARKVFPQEKVGAYMNPKFINLQIDMEGEYGAPLAKKLQISAYPTFVIFNADAQEIGRFLGSSEADDFIKNVEAKSKDNSSSDFQTRFAGGERDPQFLMQYLNSLNASYKHDEANTVAEALLEGKESTFAADSTLRMVFMRSITNPFAKSFVYTVKNPSDLKAQIGAMPVDMKIQNVLSNYQRQIINEADGTATIDQQQFDKFLALLNELNVPNASHYRLTTLITLSEKQKNYAAYLGYVKEYLANDKLDADDMQLARWTKPFSEPSVDATYKAQMKEILLHRLAEIKAGKRQPQTTVGNMRLSRPTDDLLRMIVDALDGKMPN
ncbi:MAG: thioredoxin family protein [Bacteroidaceae bacterium]|jgi:thioredoxin-related protein|nr:thioredoxin family protein [Bacteroidaceae bacterium]